MKDLWPVRFVETEPCNTNNSLSLASQALMIRIANEARITHRGWKASGLNASTPSSSLKAELELPKSPSKRQGFAKDNFDFQLVRHDIRTYKNSTCSQTKDMRHCFLSLNSCIRSSNMKFKPQQMNCFKHCRLLQTPVDNGSVYNPEMFMVMRTRETTPICCQNAGFHLFAVLACQFSSKEIIKVMCVTVLGEQKL